MAFGSSQTSSFSPGHNGDAPLSKTFLAYLLASLFPKTNCYLEEGETAMLCSRSYFCKKRERELLWHQAQSFLMYADTKADALAMQAAFRTFEGKKLQPEFERPSSSCLLSFRPSRCGRVCVSHVVGLRRQKVPCLSLRKLRICKCATRSPFSCLPLLMLLGFKRTLLLLCCLGPVFAVSPTSYGLPCCCCFPPFGTWERKSERKGGASKARS